MTIKVRRDVDNLAKEMVELGLARSRSHAYNITLEAGPREAKRLVERRRAVKRLLKEYLEKGLPFEHLPTAMDAEEKRKR